MNKEKKERVEERPLVGIGVFSAGVGYILLFSALLFLGLYYGGLKGYLFCGALGRGERLPPMVMLSLVFPYLVALGGLLAGTGIFTEEKDDLFDPISVTGSFCIWLGVTATSVVGCRFIYASLVASNAVSLSHLITALSGIVLVTVCVFATGNMLRLTALLTRRENKIASLAWVLIMIPCLIASSLIGIHSATIKNSLRDENILAQGVNIVQKEKVLEIALPLKDRDYVFRTFGVREIGNNFSLYRNAQVGRILDANKIFLSLSAFGEQKPTSLTFVSSNGKEGTFPIEKEGTE